MQDEMAFFIWLIKLVAFFNILRLCLCALGSAFQYSTLRGGSIPHVCVSMTTNQPSRITYTTHVRYMACTASIKPVSKRLAAICVLPSNQAFYLPAIVTSNRAYRNCNTIWCHLLTGNDGLDHNLFPLWCAKDARGHAIARVNDKWAIWHGCMVSGPCQVFHLPQIWYNLMAHCY